MRRFVIALPLVTFALALDRVPAPDPELPRRTLADITRAFPGLPARDEGRFQKPGDPLNMLFLGTDAQVRGALEHAGWTPLALTITASLREGAAELVAGRPLCRFPPMNDYRVLGRRQDMNWARVITPIETRHHFRLWRTGVFDPKGRELWWGSGNFDLSVRYRDLSHRPHPDMNLEREYLAETLAGSPHVEKLSRMTLAQIPLSGRNDKGYPFTSDGRALFVELR